jgi:hypothetical protein
MSSEITNSIIDEHIKKFKIEIDKLPAQLEEALNKKERQQIMKRHTSCERIVKLLYALKEYDD